MVTLSHADVYEGRKQESKVTRQLILHERHGWKNESKGELKMLNSCLAFMVLVMLGCFAAGACEAAEERAERRRIQKMIREKYGRTY